jgi:hypothetical protein
MNPKTSFQRYEELWKAEVEEQVPLPPCRIWDATVREPDEAYNLMQRLWEGEELDLYHLREWPPGTEAWKRVKLVEQIA